jgi:hypothetical protein
VESDTSDVEFGLTEKSQVYREPRIRPLAHARLKLPKLLTPWLLMPRPLVNVLPGKSRLLNVNWAEAEVTEANKATATNRNFFISSSASDSVRGDRKQF